MKSMVKVLLVSVILLLAGTNAQSRQADLITNLHAHDHISLNGSWHAIVDPYDYGYYDYRFQVSKWGYFKNAKPQTKSDLIEYDFDESGLLHVPGDWNSQRKSLFFYEGSVWYKKSFTYDKKEGKRVFVYFGAANYHARVYLNGHKLGEHKGGFTPFNFEVTDYLKEQNHLIIQVNNQRHRDAIPTVNTDWWNYGGLTRDVMLVETPETFVRDYMLQLDDSGKKIAGWVQVDGPDKGKKVNVRIPELKIDKTVKTDESGFAKIEIPAIVKRWSPDNPKLYEVEVSTENETMKDKIGFRSITTKGSEILLNGKPTFLAGICIHEQAPLREGRAFSVEDAEIILGWVKELGCNYVRLAHYPHNEHIIRLADEMGILVWSEIPVYWTILWENEETYANAERQLTEMITRDRNRASVVLWSMSNETPLSEPRLKFLARLSKKAKELDPTRLITSALERHYIDPKTQMIDDPFGKYIDVIGLNEYVGWYDGLPAKCDSLVWKTVYNKPILISEFGAGAKQGYHGDAMTRWTEEFQESVYKHQLEMLKKIPNLRGMAPWILADFRSPRRPLPEIQDFWNRKGLISDRGIKKKAFYVLQKFYHEKLGEGK